MYYYELRHSKERSGKPILIEEEKIGLATGFRSVYGFNKEVADRIKSARSTAGLKGQPVYADVLLMDFDDDFDNADKFRELLIEKGIKFQRYNSGNRSIHFHIPHPPVCESWLPAAQKRWVLAHCPTADVSFYHPSGLFRLPFTVHEKTGNMKLLLEEVDGELIEMVKPPKRKRESQLITTDPKNKAALRHRLFLNLTKTVYCGGRSQHISCMLSRDCIKLGMSKEQALEVIYKWNSNFAKPAHSIDTVENKVEYEYRKLSG